MGKENTNGIAEQMPVAVLDDYSVVVSNNDALQAFYTDPSNLDRLYDIIDNKARALVADPTTKEGASQIKSAAKQIASARIKIDNIGKDVVAKLKELPGIIDDNRKGFRKKMEALQEEVRRPVTEIEERQDKIVAIKDIHVNLAMADSVTINAEIERLKAMDLSDDTWKESAEDAVRTVEAEVNALNTLKAAAEKREEEARELDELRKQKEEADRIIRENRLKEEAAKRAKEEAEAKAAAEKARMEREKEEAERRAAEAERKAQEAAKELEEEKAKKAYVAPQAAAPSPAPAPAQKPSKWTPEMKAVNNAILDAFAAIIVKALPEYIAGHSDPGYDLAARETAKKLVGAIIKGEIRNINVRY